MTLANDVIANYDDALAKAREEVEETQDSANWLRSRLAEAEKEKEADHLALAEKEKEVEKEKEESARLRAQVERLQNRHRYLKEVEVPSMKAKQARGILRNFKAFREKKNIAIPQAIIDRLAQDLEKLEDEVSKIAVVELDDKDLL